MGAAAHDSRTGELLNQSYELHELLEPGGVADTYRATDRKRSRTVKITLLRPEFALRSGVVQRFLSLPQTLTGLRHPNVSQVIAVESDETGIPFVVEEHVEGEPLTRTIAAFPDGMPIGVAMNVVMPVIEAMAAAHKLGLVHGQLDHEHILLIKSGGTSVPKIVRFGAAAARAEPMQKGGERRVAPELHAGKASADLRSDVWSLGALLYETLCGEAPASQGAQHEALDERAPHLPTELVQLVERCLAAEPGRRPKQAEEVRAALALVRERLRGGAPPAQAGPRIGKAGVVQPDPRAAKAASHDPRAASPSPRAVPARQAPAARPAAPAPARAASPPRSAAVIESDERPTAEVPGLSALARAREGRASSIPPKRERAETPTAFAPEAEITFGSESAPEAEFEDPFAKPAVPSLPPQRPAPTRRSAASAQRAVGRKTAAGREVALPALEKAPADAALDDAFAATFEADAQFALSDTAPGDADAAFDRGFDATFDDAFAEAPAADNPLDLMPPPLPPPPATLEDDVARAFGLGATMMQRAPVVDRSSPAGFGLAETMPDDDEPEMTLEPAAQSLRAPATRSSRPNPEMKTMSDVAAAFGPMDGTDDVEQGEADGAARGREFRKKTDQAEAETVAKRSAKKKDKDKDKEPARASAPGERPSRVSSVQRARPAAPIGSPKQLRQANTPAAKLSEDQTRTLRDRVQAGERRKWRVFGSLLMLMFCFGLIFFVPLLYDPTHTKAQEKLGHNLKIALVGLMVVSVMTLVRTWVVQVQSKPMLMKPVTWTMKVVVLCVCVLAMTFFLPAGALGPAEAAARAALPWATSGFYMFLGIYGLMLGMRETANNLLYGVMLILMYGAGFGGAYRALLETVLQKHAAAAHENKVAGNTASTAEQLKGYVTGSIKAPDAGQSEPMIQQKQVGASEEEDMRSIEQLNNNRKTKSGQFDDLHKNMQKLAH